MAVKVFEGLEFLNEGLVLVFEHSHTVFKTFDILLLLPATLPGGFPGTNTRQMTTGTTCRHSPDQLDRLLPPHATARRSRFVWSHATNASELVPSCKITSDNRSNLRTGSAQPAGQTVLSQGEKHSTTTMTRTVSRKLPQQDTAPSGMSIKTFIDPFQALVSMLACQGLRIPSQ